MLTSAERLYNEALSLPLEARADLIQRLVAALTEKIPNGITCAQLDEVDWRMAQIDSGEMTPIAGDPALARVRTRFAEHQARGE